MTPEELDERVEPILPPLEPRFPKPKDPHEPCKCQHCEECGCEVKVVRCPSCVLADLPPPKHFGTGRP
jgi:hypothetical protein